MKVIADHLIEVNLLKQPAVVAEIAGKFREALMDYVAALQAAPEGSNGEQRLREKIIMLVQKVQPPPAVPEEVCKYEERAEAVFRNAKTPSDFLDAANEYKKAIRVAPWVARYYFNLGIVLEKADKQEEAIKNLKIYLEAAPNAKDARDVKNKIAGLELVEDLKRKTYITFDERKKAIEIAQKLEPPPAISEEAKRHMAEGIAALNVARDVLGYKEAEEKFEKASTAAAWWADPYFNIGIVKGKTWKFYFGFDAEREYKAAVENLNLYLLAAPNAPDANTVRSKIYELEYLWKRRFEAAGHLNRGIDLAEAKRYEEAIAAYKDAIRLDPEYGAPHHNLGIAYYYLKRYKESITENMEAIRLGYTPLGVHINLGNSYYELGDTKKAIDSLEEGLRVNRFSGEYIEMVHNNLGIFYEKTGESEKAIKHYEEAVRLNHRRKAEIQIKINNLKKRMGR
jgi:tetratricopeptide (TPR) repeat protein